MRIAFRQIAARNDHLQYGIWLRLNRYRRSKNTFGAPVGKEITLDPSTHHFADQGLFLFIGGFHLWLTSLSIDSEITQYTGLTPFCIFMITPEWLIYKMGWSIKKFDISCTKGRNADKLKNFIDLWIRIQYTRYVKVLMGAVFDGSHFTSFLQEAGFFSLFRGVFITLAL